MRTCVPTEHTTTNAAADVASAQQPATAGETPAKPEMTEAEARAALRAGSRPQAEERDPLAESPEGEDPLLTHDQDNDADPLGVLVEATEEAETDAGTTTDTEATGETPVATTESEIVAVPEAEAAKTTEDEDAHPQGRKRLNIFRKNAAGEYVYDARERAAMQFADESVIGVIEAYTRLFGEMPKAQVTPGTKEQPPEKEPTAAEIQQQILTLRQQRKDAAVGLDTIKANELTEQIEDLIDQRNAATQLEAERGRAKQTEAERSQSEQLESMHRAGALFPDVTTDGTELHTAITLEIAKIERSNPMFFRDPEWPESLTAKLAARLGVMPVVSKPSETIKPAPGKSATEPNTVVRPTPPKQAARPAPAPGGISAQAPKANVQDFQARLSAARTRNDLPAIKALMREARTLNA
jgi:hypothetical protein